MKRLKTLSRREREIMDVLYASEGASATAGEIRTRMSSPPSYSAVRATLRILEHKGFLRHEADGARYVYAPRLDRQKARTSALRHLVATFFDGSAEQAMVTLIDSGGSDLTDAELARLGELIKKARRNQEKSGK